MSRYARPSVRRPLSVQVLKLLSDLLAAIPDGSHRSVRQFGTGADGQHRFYGALGNQKMGRWCGHENGQAFTEEVVRYFVEFSVSR